MKFRLLSLLVVTLLLSLLSSFVLANTFNNTNFPTLPNGIGYGHPRGYLFNSTQNGSIKEVIKHSLVTGSSMTAHIYIFDVGSTYITAGGNSIVFNISETSVINASFAGDVATFSSSPQIVNGQLFCIMVGQNSAPYATDNYNSRYTVGASLPRVDTSFDIIRECAGLLGNNSAFQSRVPSLGHNVLSVLYDNTTNLAPVVETSRIEPIPAKTIDELKGYCNATDWNNDNISFYYNWFANGVSVKHGNSTKYIEGIERLLDNLTSNYTERGDKIIFSCMATDSSLNSTWKNSSVLLINNSYPITESVTTIPLPPTAYDIDELQGWSNVTDVDNETIVYFWKWFKNGGLYSQYINSTGVYSLDRFTNGLTTEIIETLGEGSFAYDTRFRYFTFPQNTEFSQATLNITGVTGRREQDYSSARQTGSWNGNPWLGSDNDWSTYNRCASGTCHFYINYTIYDWHDMGKSVFKWKTDVYSNATMSFSGARTTCWNASGDNEVKFGITYATGAVPRITVWCHNGSGYDVFFAGSIVADSILMYETDMLFGPRDPQSVRLYVGESNTSLMIFLQTDIGNGTTYRVNNFSRNLTNLVNDCSCDYCTLSNGNCSLPIIFGAQNGGNINYSDIKINYMSDIGNYTEQGINTNLANVSNQNTSVGDIFIFSARGYDGSVYSNWANSSSITISSSMPITRQSLIVPNETVYYNQNASGACNITDQDSSLLDYHFQWFVNDIFYSNGTYLNVPQGTLLNISLFVANATNVNKNLTFSCRGNDGTNYSNWSNSSTINIINAVSILNQVITYPSGSSEQSKDIAGACNASDLNNEILNYSFKWFVNDINILANTFNGTQNILSNISNLSSSYFNPGDEVIFECQAFDGINYSGVANSSVVNITYNIPIINELYITPIYPNSSSMLDCSFNTTDINPGSELNVSIGWYKNNAPLIFYKYNYNNVTFNLTYITANNTGSVSEVLDNYSTWICQINVTNGVERIIQNSSVVGVYPLENLTIISPDDNTYSNQTLNVTFTVIDYNNDITCNLNVNNSIVNNKSIQNGSLSWLNYTFSVDGHYNYTVSCTSVSDLNPVESFSRFYVYDTILPVAENLTTNQNTTFPEPADTILLYANVSDINNVSYCSMFINDTGAFILNTTRYINSPDTEVIFNYTIQNYSVGNMSNIAWYLRCNDTAGNINISAVNIFQAKDITYPNITWTTLGINENNLSVISNYLYNISFNISFFDNNLFQAFVNISCEVDGDIYYWDILDINTTSYNIADTVDLNSYVPQKCHYSFGASDDHTKNKIADYGLINIEKGINFETEEKNKIIIETKDIKNQYKKLKTKKEKDRYTFNFEFEEKSLEREFEVYSETGAVYYQPNSKYGGHFVVWNDETKAGNWLDFELEETNEYLKYDVQKLANNKYSVKMYIDVPQTVELKRPKFLGIPYGPTDQEELKMYLYGMDNMKFESIGGTNIVIMNYEFYIGGAVNISGIDLYDNETLENISVNVTNIATFPGVNGTQGYTVNGTSGIIENLSNGTYSFKFYKDNQYVERTYIVDVNANLINQLYETAESVITLSLINIKSGNPVYNAIVTIQKNGTLETRNATGDNTTSTFIFWLDADAYNITATAPFYDITTTSFSTVYTENKTIILSMIFLTTFNLMDEKTIAPFNINSPDAIRFILICKDSQYTFLVTNQTQSFPITCNYTQFKFDLEYSGESYYRKLIIEPNIVDNMFNQTVWLIDLNTTTAIYNSLFIDDLLEDYDDTQIFVYKIINNTKEQITADYTDIENKIGAYLIRNHQYLIEIHSSNHPIKLMGTYSADLEGDKTIRLYDINIGGETTGSVNQVTFVTQSQNISGTLYATAMFNDPENKTSEVTWTVFEGDYGGTVLFSSTLTRPINGSVNFEGMFNISAYENDIIISYISFENDDIGTSEYSRIINAATSIQLEIIEFVGREFLDWFFILLIGMLALMATIQTGNIVSMVLVMFATVFVVFDWFRLSAGILALAGLVALIAMIKGGTHEK